MSGEGEYRHDEYGECNLFFFYLGWGSPVFSGKGGTILGRKIGCKDVTEW